ncbi:hypothetical protein BJX76DRAFT_358843 [Aspergillus varians]
MKKKDFPTDTATPFNSLQWQLDVPFTYKPRVNKRLRRTVTPHSEIGHALPYGSREDVDTNLVVVVTKRAYTSRGAYQAKAHMDVNAFPSFDA